MPAPNPNRAVTHDLAGSRGHARLWGPIPSRAAGRKEPRALTGPEKKDLRSPVRSRATFSQTSDDSRDSRHSTKEPQAPSRCLTPSQEPYARHPVPLRACQRQLQCEPPFLICGKLGGPQSHLPPRVQTGPTFVQFGEPGHILCWGGAPDWKSRSGHETQPCLEERGSAAQSQNPALPASAGLLQG